MESVNNKDIVFTEKCNALGGEAGAGSRVAKGGFRRAVKEPSLSALKVCGRRLVRRSGKSGFHGTPMLRKALKWR